MYHLSKIEGLEEEGSTVFKLGFQFDQILGNVLG